MRASMPMPSIPEFDAYLADLEHGSDPRAALYRGRVVVLPVLESPDDLPFDLAARLAGRRAVLLFYPGGWCPAARRALVRFDALDEAFRSASATVVGVTPETPVHARRTLAETGAALSLAVDHMSRFARSLGLAFKLPLQLRRTVRDRGVRLSVWNGEQSYDLPMPATVLLDRRCRVRCVHAAWTADALDPSDVLQALAAMPASD
jgi:peroxiredoxin